LVRHFAQKYARRMKKPIETIPTAAMSDLVDYHWPGNVRELENLIERAVILSRGSELEISLSELKQQTVVPGQEHRLTPHDKAASMMPNAVPEKFSYYGAVDDYRRGLIVRTLAHTEGNRAAAAKILGLQRTYLSRLIKSLCVA
jgi:DNA-binding NtrC family response regulator